MKNNIINASSTSDINISLEKDNKKEMFKEINSMRKCNIFKYGTKITSLNNKNSLEKKQNDIIIKHFKNK